MDGCVVAVRVEDFGLPKSAVGTVGQTSKIFRCLTLDFCFYDRQMMKMGLNGVEVNPHGLIFDEDGATGCLMPLEDLPTPLKVVLDPF